MRYIEVADVPPLSIIGFGMLVATPANIAEIGAVLDEFVTAGGTLIDTAHTYGDGDADRALGQWLRGRNRQSVAILAKGGHPLDDGVPRVTPDALRADLDDTLERIGSDYVDIFVLHRDDPAVPVGQLLETTEAIRADGQALAFGVSNWSLARIREAHDYAITHGLTPFALNSPGMSLAVAQEPMWPGCVYVDDELGDYHRATRMPLAAWSAQARGFFSGRVERDKPVDADLTRVYGTPSNFDRLDRATTLGAERGFTPNQVALAWLLAQAFPVAALITPKTPQQLSDSLRALELEFSREDLRWLESGER